MVGYIGAFDPMIGFFLGMVGTVRFSSSLSSSSCSVSPLVVPLMMVLFPRLLVTIAREVSDPSTILTYFFSFASFFLIGWYLIVLGAIVGGSSVVSLGFVSVVFGSGLDDCIPYSIGVLISGTIQSHGVSDSVSFPSNPN